jgi:hypothetical protein
MVAGQKAGGLQQRRTMRVDERPERGIVSHSHLLTLLDEVAVLRRSQVALRG